MFGGWGHFGFKDYFAPFCLPSNFSFRPCTGGQKIKLAQKIHAIRG